MMIELSNLIEDVMDLMRSGVNQEKKKQRGDAQIERATDGRDILMVVHLYPDAVRGTRRNAENQDDSLRPSSN